MTSKASATTTANFISRLKERIRKEMCRLDDCAPCRQLHVSAEPVAAGHLQQLRVAAVLIGLQFDEVTGSWRYLLTLRRRHMRRNGGETCFPGGMVDREDPTVVDAALREAQEEVGLESHDCQVIGVLPPVISLLGVLVHQVITVIRRDFVPKPNPNEVADVFYVDANRVCDGLNHSRIQLIYRGENLGANYYHYEYNNHMYSVYGLTGSILANLSCLTDGPISCQLCQANRQLADSYGGVSALLHRFLHEFDTDGRIWSYILLREISVSNTSILETSVLERSRISQSLSSKL